MTSAASRLHLSARQLRPKAKTLTCRIGDCRHLEKGPRIMNWLINRLSKMRLFQGDLDLHLVRASMVVIYFFFGYQKWFDYEAQGLIPFFTHGPLIFWMVPVFGMKVSTYFLGASEWLFGALLLAGFGNRKLGVLGALGSVVTFLCTVTIIPFMPDGWAR